MKRLADEVVDHHMQLVHIEGLGEISVGTLLETFKTVGDIGFRSEHHHRHMTDIHICLHHAEEGEAIHLRHHHVTYHQVELFLTLYPQQTA